MSIDAGDIRPAMDVYTRDDVYLGSVRKVVPGRLDTRAKTLPPTTRQTSAISGEMLGPMPTRPLGNPGPQAQAAQQRHATDGDARAPLGAGSMIVGTWWGLVNRRAIPLGAIKSFSMERITLALDAAELDDQHGQRAGQERAGAGRGYR